MSLSYQISQLRHLYGHLKAGRVAGNAGSLADGLLAPVIRELEWMETEQQKKAPQ